MAAAAAADGGGGSGGGGPIPAPLAAEDEREESIVVGGAQGAHATTTMTDAERHELALNRMAVMRPSPDRTGTLWSSTLILVSSIFGSSVLAIPYALTRCGFALGAACLLGCALLTQAGAWMLVECARRAAAEEGKGVGAGGTVVLPVRVTLTQIAARVTPWMKDLPEVRVGLGLVWGVWWLALLSVDKKDFLIDR